MTNHINQHLYRDEGVPPYIPEIQIQARSYINYNQTVSAIKGIKTAHTGLESTSIVFVYGIGKPLPLNTPC